VEDPSKVDSVVPGAGASASEKVQRSAAIKTQVRTLCLRGIVKICANK